MKYFELTKEEKKLLKEVEKGEWIPVKNQKKAKKNIMLAAKNTLNKSKNINILLSERDLQKIKAKAAEDGIPYQTLVSSILHNFVRN